MMMNMVFFVTWIALAYLKAPKSVCDGIPSGTPGYGVEQKKMPDKSADLSGIFYCQNLAYFESGLLRPRWPLGVLRLPLRPCHVFFSTSSVGVH